MTLHWFLSSCVLICAILLLRRLLRGRISMRLQYALWLVVLARLLIPGTLFPAPFSLAAVSQQSGLDQAVDNLRREITPTQELYGASPADVSMTPEEYAQYFIEDFHGRFYVYDVTESFTNASGKPYPDNGTQHFVVTTELMVGNSARFWQFL